MPISDDKATDSGKRIQMAEDLVKTILEDAKDFDSIHPLNATAYDEELTLIEHSFMSNMPESMMYVPTYGKWLLEADQSHAYNELIEYLKILQWQNPARRKQKWVLKSPHHLTALPTVLKAFPNALIIMTHRNITDVLPSWYSMVGSLTMANTTADKLTQAQAKHWTQRLDLNLQSFLQMRDSADDRFLDLHYLDLLKNPIDSCLKIFDKIGWPIEEGDLSAFKDHLSQNTRDNRPKHVYDISDYDMTLDTIREQFSYYENFIRPAN